MVVTASESPERLYTGDAHGVLPGASRISPPIAKPKKEKKGKKVTPKPLMSPQPVAYGVAAPMCYESVDDN